MSHMYLTYGDHAASCGGNSDCIFQHNAIRDALAVFGSTICSPCPQEKVPSLIPGSSGLLMYFCHSRNRVSLLSSM